MNKRLASALQAAILRNQLHLAYQPQICLRIGRTVGLEALTRWEASDAAVSGPLDLVQLTERRPISPQRGLVRDAADGME